LYDLEDVNEIIKRCEATLWLIAKGRDMVKEINRGYLLENLEIEIDELFGAQEIFIDTVTLDAWMNGRASITTNRVSLSYLRIHPDFPNTIQTSQQVEIPIQEAIELFNELKKVAISGAVEPIQGKTIGSFIVESFEDHGEGYLLTAGCHMIPWAHIQDFAERFLLKAIG
jgi:hypothetical protein